MPKDAITIDVEVSKKFLAFLQQPLERREVGGMIFELDSHLFGDNGQFKQSIKNQSAPGVSWKPLSIAYYNWKARMLGKSIPGEPIKPDKVISTDIWERTGKALTFTETEKNGRFKKIVVKATELWKGKNPIYEVFVKGITYIHAADAARPLFFWYPATVKFVQNLFAKYVAKKISQMGTGGTLKIRIK